MPLSTETFVPERDSCCCTPPRVPACGFFLLHAKDFLLCPLLLFAEVKMQAWCLKGFVGTNPLLFGLQACTQVLLIVRKRWLRSNIADFPIPNIPWFCDFEHIRCFANQDMVRKVFTIEISRENVISCESTGAFLQCCYGVESEIEDRHLLGWLLWSMKLLS